MILVEFAFLGEQGDLYNINTHILTKQGLDVELNSICECGTMTKTVTALKTQPTTKTARSSA